MSPEAATTGERTSCEQCGLPYYVDHGACPYCEHASITERTESSADAASRPRTTCDDCGLPYYTDENERCPYCERGSMQPSEPVTETAPRKRADVVDLADAETSETEPSLLKRLSNRVRGVLQGR